jgi:hypothetical protein
LLGLAFSLAGLYCFVREPESVRWLSISAAACALGIFTKQSLIAFPAAIAIQLFFTSRKHLAIWLGAAAGTCLALLLLTYALDGRYFFDHLLLPRAYYPAALWESLGAYLYFTEVAFIVAVVWILRTAQPPSRRFLIWGFLVAHALGAFYCGGAGVGVNHMFDALILTAIIAGLSLPSLTKLAEDTPHPQLALTFLLVVPFFLTSLVVLTRRLPADLGHAPNEIAQNEAEFAGVANFLRARPGPALCETLMLCNAAGKPLTYDPFVVDQLIRTGTITQDKLVQLITSRQYPVIEIDWTANEPMTPAPRLRFPGPAMRALYATYQLSLRTQKYAVFTPRP